MYLINEILTEYAKEGTRLYEKLFLEVVTVNSPTDSERYLLDHARYSFIANMFSDMQIYNWRREDFELPSDAD